MKSSTSICVLVICLGLTACTSVKQYTGEAPALVTDMHTTGSGKNRDISISFRYAVKGKTYDVTLNRTRSSAMKYPTGTQGKVCYIPADPQKAYFADARDVCGQ